MTITRWAKLCCLTFLFAPLSATAFGQQAERDLRPRNCAIQGRVTVGGQAAANTQVIASEISQSRRAPAGVRLAADGSLARTVYKTRTDSDGQYQFTALPAGAYSISVFSRAFVAADNNWNRDLGRTITLDEGESRDKVDFSLVRGGVLTGQVTDSEGRPVIGRQVNLFRVEANGRLDAVDGRDGYGHITTDDRGVYRAYGLRTWRYVINVNGEGVRSSIGAEHRRTFHPSTLNEKQARVIELKAGEEKTEIDVKLALSGKRYEALGRLVDGETGKPLPNINLSCGKVAKLNENQEDSGGDWTLTDAQGNFRLSGLSSGRYAVSIRGEGANKIEYYVEDAFFEIGDENISGVEVKAITGGVISGLVVIEGPADPALKASLSQVRLIPFIQKEPPSSSGGSAQMVTINADGTFRFGGLEPGILRLQIFGFRDSSFRLLRMERGGGQIKGNLVIGRGEKINDLRLVFGEGNGVIRGLVQIIGEPLPKGWQLWAFASRPGNSGSITPGGSAGVDEKGRFVIEGLPGGEYDLLVRASPPEGSHGNIPLPGFATQKVTVGNGAEVQVTVNFDSTPKPRGERQ